MIGLGTRLAWSVTIIIIGTALLGGAALAGLHGLSRHFDSSQEQYDELRTVFEIGHEVATLRLMAASDNADRESLRGQAVLIARTICSLRTSTMAGHSADAEFQSRLSAIDAHMDRLLAQISADSNTSINSSSLNSTLGSVAWLAGESKKGIIENRRLAAEQADRTTGIIAIVFAITMLIGVGIAFMLHRAVMKPVRALRQAVHQLAHAQFNRTIRETGDRELRDLIRHFNAMSREIHRLHESMQVQVDAKSRQLVRSEQLASVGYLAAGIAHEINNPLGIIAGHAELTLRRMESNAKTCSWEDLRDQARNAMNIICDEAFRCRDITGDLLQMARPMTAATVSVCAIDVVRRAISLVQSLPVADGKSIIVSSEHEDSRLVVEGHRSQLLQVMINLLTNALEACEPDVGRVLVSVHRSHDAVSIEITDNGCGMADEILAYAFDPFFTDKPQRGLSGTGLGLSLCHSIIERHSGVLSLVSDGPGFGSTALVQLPIAMAERSGLNAPYEFAQ